MTDQREPVIYTAEQAGEMLGGKSAEWMMEEARAGRIAYSKAGTTTLFLPEHLLAYLRANERKPTTALASRPPAKPHRPPADGAPVLESRPPRSRRKAA